MIRKLEWIFQEYFRKLNQLNLINNSVPTAIIELSKTIDRVDLIAGIDQIFYNFISGKSQLQHLPFMLGITWS